MKKIILILSLLACGIQAFAEELSSFYVKMKSGSVAQVELMAIKAFGEDYCDYNEEQDFFSFECSQLAKYKFLEELRKLDMIVEEAKEENSYYISIKEELVIEEVEPEGNIYTFDTSSFSLKDLVELQKILGAGITGARKDKVCVKDADIVSIKKSFDEIGFVCTFSDNSVYLKEKEFALEVEFDSSIKKEVLGVLRNYTFDIRDLDSSFGFSIKKSNVKFLMESLNALKGVASLSMPDNSRILLVSEDMTEYRVRIYLSSKKEVANMMESLRASEGYIIDDAFENSSAGTLSLELKVLSYDMPESKIKSDISQKAKHINSNLRASDVKIDKVSNE